MEKEIDCLLNDVKLIVVRNQAEEFKQGKQFNVFVVQGIDCDEVKTCRFIRELLDPKGSHGQGGVFLKRFMNSVIKVSGFTDAEYNDAHVVCEENIGNLRRIDIVIRIGGRMFPMEVKLYAEDQERQCEEYYEYAVKSDPETKIYYLTLDGHEPSDWSKGKLKEDQYECLSFESDIIGWVDECIHVDELEQIYPVREILIQFRNVLRELTGTKKGKTEMEIREKIESSYDNMLAALAIENIIPEIKADKMKSVFGLIKEHMKSLGYEDAFEYYEEESEKYYRGKRNTYPSLGYTVPIEDESLKEKMAIRFEIEERLYFGICPWSPKDNWNIDKEQKAIVGEYVKAHLLPSDVKPPTTYWYWWKYLDNANDVNFRSCNEGYIKLYDPDGFKNYIDSVISTIDATLSEIFDLKKN